MKTTDGNKIKVLFIAGWGRSGSTILDRILGQIEGFHSIGEFRYIWDRNMIEDRLCGCGVPFSKCGYWREVTKTAFNGENGVNPSRMVELRDNNLRSRHTIAMMSRRVKNRLVNQLQEYFDNLSILYSAIQKISGCEFIVDSSKSPTHGWALSQIQGIELYTVHLVRDPRAAAFSWSRPKMQPDTGKMAPMKRIGTIKSSTLWTLWNLAIEKLKKNNPDKCILLRYEDFAENPRQSVDRILKMTGTEKNRNPIIGERCVKLEIGHTASGNPDRFKTGEVEIKNDQRWRSQMKLSQKLIASLFSFPAARLYGYL